MIDTPLLCGGGIDLLNFRGATLRFLWDKVGERENYLFHFYPCEGLKPCGFESKLSIHNSSDPLRAWGSFTEILDFHSYLLHIVKSVRKSMHVRL